jgi:hypothetical protein
LTANGQDIANKQGTKSKEYLNAQKQIAEILAKVHSKSEHIIVIAMPLHINVQKRDNYGSYQALPKEKLAVRAAGKSAINSTFPKTTIPTYWSSHDACVSNTANCSGHGTCIKKWSEKVSKDEAGPEGWACACQATVIQTGSRTKTTNWGGPACQKKDISVPFFLLAGFTVVAVSVIAYGIGLLFSIGQEDLPSVLGAGVAPTIRK